MRNGNRNLSLIKPEKLELLNQNKRKDAKHCEGQTGKTRKYEEKKL